MLRRKFSYILHKWCRYHGWLAVPAWVTCCESWIETRLVLWKLMPFWNEKKITFLLSRITLALSSTSLFPSFICPNERTNKSTDKLLSAILLNVPKTIQMTRKHWKSFMNWRKKWKLDAFFLNIRLLLERW